jgi:uncharacterized oligopeptide transporter (OPT) family protein
MVLIRHYVWVGKLEWVRAYHPNMMCVALAFVLPQTFCKSISISPSIQENTVLTLATDGTAMMMGSTLAVVWAKKNPITFDIIGYPIAAGLIAGEGIGGVINAIIQIAGASGSVYGSWVACPGPENCAG